MYKNDYKTFAYCERHCDQSTLKYNEPRPRTLSKALFNPIPDQEGLQESSDELDETSDELNEIVDEIREDISGSQQVDFDENQDQATDQEELGR